MIALALACCALGNGEAREAARATFRTQAEVTDGRIHVAPRCPRERDGDRVCHLRITGPVPQDYRVTIRERRASYRVWARSWS